MHKLVAEAERHDGDVWEDDCVVVILAPFADRSRTYAFFVNPRGTRRDEAQDDPAWDIRWRAGTRSGLGSWVAEIAIPFRSLDLTTDAASPWGLNVARHERPHNEVSTWAPVADGRLGPGVLEGVTADFAPDALRTLDRRIDALTDAVRAQRRAARRHDAGPRLLSALGKLRAEARDLARAARGRLDLAAVARLERRCTAAEAHLARIAGLLRPPGP
jgi:hypothetical protein